MIQLNVKVTDMPDIDLDLTRELIEACSIVASEIRGAIKRGHETASETTEASYSYSGGKLSTFASETTGNPLAQNEGKYAEWKMKKLGHVKPLIAEHEKFIDQNSYKISSPKKNHALLYLSGSTHPKSQISISDLGFILHYGKYRTKDRPPSPRPFFGVSPNAIKRIFNLITQRIEDLIKGEKVHA